MMHRETGKCSRLILRKILEEGVGELSSRHPIVLSCGGIYIPHGAREGRRFSYDIITTPNDHDPVKVVTGVRPMNILQQVLTKESMN